MATDTIYNLQCLPTKTIAKWKEDSTMNLRLTSLYRSEAAVDYELETTDAECSIKENGLIHDSRLYCHFSVVVRNLLYWAKIKQNKNLKTSHNHTGVVKHSGKNTNRVVKNIKLLLYAIMYRCSLCPYAEVTFNYHMYGLLWKPSTRGRTTRAVNASEYANTRPHVCAPVRSSVSVCTRCACVAGGSASGLCRGRL